MDTGFHGVISDGPPAGSAQEEQPGEFQGMGPILEDDPKDVFQETESMIRRQELLALNRWNQDEYFKTTVKGYPWGRLQHDMARDTYSFELPYGVSALDIEALPNKNLDLVNEAAEQLLVDFPEADCQPVDDSEDAQDAAEMADRFLSQNAGEQGTNDAVLFDDRVKLALVTSSSYIEYWTDPTAGGYVPLQIEAHPQAQSPDDPLVGPDGMPTTDYVLRYVTAPQGGQFTEDPFQAAPQWQPRVMTEKWAREHIRCYPENKPVELADQIIILGYATLGQLKKRSPTVAAMAPEDLNALCDWTPPRYLHLLPPYQRARWKLSDGKNKNKMGSSDERIAFYYHRFIKPCPDYRKGAVVMMSGVDGGTILDKRLLAVDVEVPAGAGKRVKETRCREIPIVQITPRGDPFGQDPTGLAYLDLFVGATKANATLGNFYVRALKKILTQPFATSSLSPISGADVEAARSSGDFLSVVRPEDMPKQLEPPILPSAFFNMYSTSLDATDRIAHRTRATSGEEAPEKSGRAIQLAVSQNNIGNNSMLTAVNNSYTRGCRIVLEIVMGEYTTAQQIAYVGEDGANKQAAFAANDFALVGKVSVKAGTGTGLSQDGKVQYLANLKAEGFIGDEESREAAKPSFAKRLGIPANPFEQYVSRACDTWLQGPPPPRPNAPPNPQTGQPMSWQEEYGQWLQAEKQFEQQMQQFQQQQQAFQQYLNYEAIVAGGAPPVNLGPEQQNEKAMQDFENASIQMRVLMQQNPGVQAPPVQPQPPQIPKPWTPFETRPIDSQPEIADMWLRKTNRLVASSEYHRWGPEWTDTLDRKNTEARQAKAVASGAQAPRAQAPPKSGSSAGGNPTPTSQPQQPTQPMQPSPPPGPAGG